MNVQDSRKIDELFGLSMVQWCRWWRERRSGARRQFGFGR